MILERARIARLAAIASFGLTITVAPTVSARTTPPAGSAACAAVGDAQGAGTPSAHGGMMGTPAAGMPMMDGLMGSPMAGMDPATMNLDLMYIDMMVPHHASIIAMAEAASPRLEDERLREIAQAVIATQQPEIAELGVLRERLGGETVSPPMDGPMMAAMEAMMPGMGSMAAMGFQMDAAAQVAAICAAEDADRAFIDLTIPHHEMAVISSRQIAERTTDPEMREFAQRVIDAQEREIKTLTQIRQELYDAVTPTAIGG